MRKYFIAFAALTLAGSIHAQNWNNPIELGMMQWRLDQSHSEDSEYRAYWRLPNWNDVNSENSTWPETTTSQWEIPPLDENYSKNNRNEDDENILSTYEESFPNEHFRSYPRTQWNQSFEAGLQAGFQIAPLPSSNYRQDFPQLTYEPTPLYGRTKSHVDTEVSFRAPQKLEIKENAFQKAMDTFVQNQFDDLDKSRPLGPDPTPLGFKFGTPKAQILEVLGQKPLIQNYGDEIMAFGGGFDIAGYPVAFANYTFHEGLLQSCFISVKSSKDSLYDIYRALSKKLITKYGKPYRDTIKALSGTADSSNLIVALFKQDSKSRNDLIKSGRVQCETHWWFRDYSIMLTLDYINQTKECSIGLLYDENKNIWN